MSRFKDGVDHRDMSPHITDRYPEMDSVCREVTGRDCMITSARDGKHGANSLHYTGEAVDLRTGGLSSQKQKELAQKLARKLGRDYDVVLEHDHIHVEYDPPSKKLERAEARRRRRESIHPGDR